MSKSMRHKIYVGMAVLAAVILISGATILATSSLATASPATTSDPLISLSYLNNVFGPAITREVTNQLNNRASQVEANIRASLSSNPAQTFIVVELSNGQTRNLANGAEVMLRAGSAGIASGTFVNQTAGTEHGSGALTANNMYIAASAGSITASANGTRLLIRG